MIDVMIQAVTLIVFGAWLFVVAVALGLLLLAIPIWIGRALKLKPRSRP